MVLGSLRRLKYRILTFRDYGKLLNRCATIEQRLLDVANGKRGNVPPEECREWARYLGGNDESR